MEWFLVIALVAVAGWGVYREVTRQVSGQKACGCSGCGSDAEVSEKTSCCGGRSH